MAPHDYIILTMNETKVHQIPAGEFKARCLALLSAVSETGEILEITKRGKPVARVVPIEPAPKRRPPLPGSILWQGDIVSPLGEVWEADR